MKETNTQLTSAERLIYTMILENRLFNKAGEDETDVLMKAEQVYKMKKADSNFKNSSQLSMHDIKRTYTADIDTLDMNADLYQSKNTDISAVYQKFIERIESEK